jgi:hypothetical protein
LLENVKDVLTAMVKRILDEALTGYVSKKKQNDYALVGSVLRMISLIILTVSGDFLPCTIES